MTVQPRKKPQRPFDRMRLPPLMLLAALFGAIAGLAAVYGIGGLKRNQMLTEADPSCAPAVESAKRLAAVARGQVAALTLASIPRRMPELSFRDGEGKTVRLEDFRGRTVLVNLWATWCGPCRKEMPSLDALQETIGGREFEVVAINLDTRESAKPRRFLEEIGAKHLAYFEDPSNGVFQALRRFGRASGLPTSIIVDRQGCELAVLAGPAEWASEDALKFVRAAIGG
jgi:thiol-disulfide isomerase/thioredoxin